MRRSALALFTLVLVTAVPASAADGRIAHLQVNLDGHRVLVAFRLLGGFDAELAERAESGLPTAVVYEIELLRDRKRWFDDRIASTELQVVALYDGLAREYLVNTKLDGRLIESRMVQSLDELERAMTRFEGLPAFTVRAMEGRPRLLVKVRAHLGSKTVFSLIPTRISTNWRESKKFNPPRAASPP